MMSSLPYQLTLVTVGGGGDLAPLGFFGLLFFYTTNLDKGHPPSADLRYKEEDGICLSTLILAAIKS